MMHIWFKACCIMWEVYYEYTLDYGVWQITPTTNVFIKWKYGRV
jgi:hypothetical protein